jgi:hypothetical protein
VNATTVFRRRVRQPAAITRVVVVAEEDCATIIAALNDVKWPVAHKISAQPCHAASSVEDRRARYLHRCRKSTNCESSKPAAAQSGHVWFIFLNEFESFSIPIQQYPSQRALPRLCIWTIEDYFNCSCSNDLVRHGSLRQFERVLIVKTKCPTGVSAAAFGNEDYGRNKLMFFLFALEHTDLLQSSFGNLKQSGHGEPQNVSADSG